MLITRLPDLRFDPDRGQLSDWISAAAKHRLVDDDRHRKNHFMRRLGSEAADQLASREPDPSISFERSRLVDLVREALTEIRPHVAQHDYGAFTLRWVEGLSVREIAERLGMAESQIWSSHHRLSLKLRPILARRLNTGA